MSMDFINAQIKAASAEYTDAEMRLASLGLLAIATIARDADPAAAYVLLNETDQNDSGELWVQAVYDVEHNEIADSEAFDEDPVAYHLHEGNEVVWLPFVVNLSSERKGAQGQYLLDIRKVLNEVSARPSPTIFRTLDMSTAHLPPEMRDDLNQYDGVIADERSYGWLLWVPEDIDQHIVENDVDGSIPPAVIAIYRKAAEHRCQYVLLDQDASLVGDLPTYDD